MSLPHAGRSPLRNSAPCASRASNSPALASSISQLPDSNAFAQSDNLDDLFGSADCEFLDPAALPYGPFDTFEGINSGQNTQSSEHIDFNDAAFSETFDINNISGFSDADFNASADFNTQNNTNLFYGDNSNYAPPFIADTQQDQNEYSELPADCITTQMGDDNSDNETQASYHSGSSGEHGNDDHASPAPVNVLNPGQPLPDVANMGVPELDRLYLKVMRHHGFQPIQRRPSASTAQVPVPASAPATSTAPFPASVVASTPAPALTRPRASTIATATPTTGFAVPAPVTTVADFAAPPPAPMYTNNNSTLTEQNYRPLTQEGIFPPDPQAPRPLYPAYTGRFATGQEARQYRKRRRIAPKSQAPDLERVKRCGRMYWVHRIYNAMIDISSISDGHSSIHRTRFEQATAFSALDLEAAAHHVFDGAVAVHERGWNKPLVYHKKVVRGKLVDVSEKSVEKRLARICTVLQQRKASVDDAVRGGVTLALLCDNPEARGFTKCSNNAGNEKRGKRLKFVKGLRIEDDAGEEEEGERG